MKQQKTFVCKIDVGRKGITVFSQPPPPPGHQWRAAVMFLTYVPHSKCVRGCWWGEVQQRRSEARQTHTVMPAVLEHFECGLCIVVNAGSLSSDLCLTLHLPPLLGYVSNISTPGKKHSFSSVGDWCLFFFRGWQPVSGVRRWGVPASCGSRNQRVGPETEESVGLLVI